MTVRKCCIINCNNTSRNSDVSFYCFPKYKHKLIQREKWISIVRKQNGYTSSWNPTSKDLICSAHFIGDKKGEEELSPNYVPSKFYSPQWKPKLNEETVLARHQRFIKRRLQNTSLGSSSKNNENSSLNSKSAANTEVSMDISSINNISSVYEND